MKIKISENIEECCSCLFVVGLLKKILMLGKIEGRKKRAWERTRWLGGIIQPMDMGLSELWEMVKDKGAWSAAVHEVTESWTWLSNWTSAPAGKSLQSCLTLRTPIDGSQQGSSSPGILQVRILEWVAISFSNTCMHAKSLQSYQTLCDPMNNSPPGSSVHGIL